MDARKEDDRIFMTLLTEGRNAAEFPWMGGGIFLRLSLTVSEDFDRSTNTLTDAESMWVWFVMMIKLLTIPFSQSEVNFEMRRNFAHNNYRMAEGGGKSCRAIRARSNRVTCQTVKKKIHHKIWLSYRIQNIRTPICFTEKHNSWSHVQS